MVDTNVGIRELKESAPELVRRAERGERIVVTRHGKPVAVLAPPSSEEGNAVTPKTSAWLRERRAFEQMQPKLERRYRGRYVAVLGAKVVGNDTDHNRLFEKTWNRFGGQVFYIGRVAQESPVIDIPGFELEPDEAQI